MSSVSNSQSDYGRYLFEYRFNGSEWAIEITAKNPEEAKQRLGALTWARYRGEITARIPIPSTNLFNRIGAWSRQFTAMRGLSREV